VKIAVLGFDLPLGKIKYQDSRLLAIEKKSSPKKTHPFFVEFVSDLKSADAVVSSKDRSLDLFIPDLERIEKRLTSAEEAEKDFLKRCCEILEKEVPLREGGFSPQELTLLRNLGLLTLKPTLILETLPQDLNQLIVQVFNKAGVIFFYTLAKLELKSWLIEADTPIVKAAEKIHSDLAKGFIKAEVINFDDFIKVHNLEEAKTKGLVKVVGKDYIVKDGDILEIKFKVQK